MLRPDGVFLIVDIVRSPSDSGRSLWFWKKQKKLYHAKEEDYHRISTGNNLIFKQIESITERIIQGYEGYLSWIDRGNMNLMNYLLIRVFSSLQVRLNVAELRSRKQYMLFYGKHD